MSKVTQQEMADAFEISRVSLAKWRKEGMPGDLRGAVAWVRRNKPLETEGDTLSDSKKRKLDAEARLKELDLLVREGKLIDREESKSWLVGEISALKQHLFALPRRLPGELEGLPARDMEPVLRKSLYEVCRRMGSLRGKK